MDSSHLDQRMNILTWSKINSSVKRISRVSQIVVFSGAKVMLDAIAVL